MQIERGKEGGREGEGGRKRDKEKGRERRTERDSWLHGCLTRLSHSIAMLSNFLNLKMRLMDFYDTGRIYFRAEKENFSNAMFRIS